MYTLNPGTFDEFFAYWQANIVPAREACGFSILAAWRQPEENRFVWVVRFNGEGSFEDADAAYYDSPMRSALPKTSGKFVASSDVRMIETLDGFLAVPAA